MLGYALAGVLDENPSHLTAKQSLGMEAVARMNCGASHKPKKSFVNKTGRLQGFGWAFIAQILSGHRTHLGVNRFYKRAQRPLPLFIIRRTTRDATGDRVGHGLKPLST